MAEFSATDSAFMARALRLAESLAPCVLWMDEIEKGFATGSGDSADGGTGRRLLGMFLTWMQENRKQVFLVGTANDLDLLPPHALLEPKSSRCIGYTFI